MLQIASLNNIGVTYKKAKDYSTALIYFNKCTLFDSILNTKPKKRARLINNIAYCNFKLNKKNTLNNFLKALKIRDSINDASGKIQSYFNLSEYYLDKKNTAKSKKYLDKAISNSHKINEIESILKALLLLPKVDPENATNYLNRYIILNDSILKVEQKFKTEFSKIEFETNEKEKENLQLTTEKAEQSKQLVIESKRKWLLAYGLIFLLIGVCVFGFYYKRNLKQKKEIEALQKELHHRIKNNLAIIHRFVEVTKEDIENPKLENKLNELENRIESISYVHELLYKSNNLTTINIKKYIDSLVTNIAFSFPEHNIKIVRNIEKLLQINTDKSFPIGLIINEFITNSFKYAFNNQLGIITISLKKTDKNYTLALQDNGKGIPEELDLENLNSFGIRIMKLLSQQLKGTFSLKNKNGTLLIITIPTN